MEKYDGDPGKFRSWFFDLTVALGQIDGELVSQLQGLESRYDAVGQETQPEKWDPTKDPLFKMELYHKYKGELYSVLCSLTSGDAKSVLRGLDDVGLGGMDSVGS